MSNKRNFAQAFPTLSSAFYVASSAYNAFKRRRTSYTLQNPNETNMAATRQRFKRRRGGSRTITRRRKFGRRRGPYKKIRRIWRFMRSKGLKSIETKYSQAFGDSGDTISSTGVYNLAESNATVSAGSLAVTPKILFSNSIAKGTSRNQRVGNKIFLRHLKWRMMIQHAQSGGNADEIYVAVIIIRVKQAMARVDANTSSDPMITQVFENITNTGAPKSMTSAVDSRTQFVNAWWHFYNSKNRNDYQVLYRRIIKVSKEQGASEEKRIFMKNIKIMKPCFWDDNDNQGDGHIYAFWFSDVTNSSTAIAGTDLPRIFYGYRLTFTDV